MKNMIIVIILIFSSSCFHKSDSKNRTFGRPLTFFIESAKNEYSIDEKMNIIAKVKNTGKSDVFINTFPNDSKFYIFLENTEQFVLEEWPVLMLGRYVLKRDIKCIKPGKTYEKDIGHYVRNAFIFEKNPVKSGIIKIKVQYHLKGTNGKFPVWKGVLESNVIEIMILDDSVSRKAEKISFGIVARNSVPLSLESSAFALSSNPIYKKETEHNFKTLMSPV